MGVPPARRIIRSRRAASAARAIGGLPPPGRIGQGGAPDGEGRAGDRPGPERLREGGGETRFAEGEAEPDAGETVGLSEGAQDHEARAEGGPQGLERLQVGEGLVDDEQAAAAREVAGERPQRSGLPGPSVRVVGVHDHDHVRVPGRRESRHGRDGVAGPGPGGGVLGIGRSQHGDPAAGLQARQGLDQDLGSGRGHDALEIGHAVGLGGGRAQGREVGGRGQAPEGAGVEGRTRIGHRIDPRGEIDPGLGRLREQAPGGIEVAAMGDSASPVPGPRAITETACPGPPSPIRPIRSSSWCSPSPSRRRPAIRTGSTGRSAILSPGSAR